jgi:hypothetical protein
LDVNQEAAEGTGQFKVYRDPLLPAADSDWLCAAEPVFVARSDKRLYDSGWTVMVEERRGEVLAPLEQLWGLVVSGGLTALGLVVLVLTAIWIYVLVKLQAAGDARRFVRRLVGLAETATQTAGAPSERLSEMTGSLAASAATAEPKSAGGEHG